MIIFIFAILIILSESDRLFSKTPYEFLFYYSRGVFMLGIYNSLLRLFHLSHKHFFDVNMFEDDKILKKIGKLLKMKF